VNDPNPLKDILLIHSECFESNFKSLSNSMKTLHFIGYGNVLRVLCHKIDKIENDLITLSKILLCHYKERLVIFSGHFDVPCNVDVRMRTTLVYLAVSGCRNFHELPHGVPPEIADIGAASGVQVDKTFMIGP